MRRLLLAVLAATLVSCATSKVTTVTMARESVELDAIRADEAWMRAGVYVATHATKRVQLATDNVIRTYDCVWAHEVCYTVLKEPLSAGRRRITVICAADKSDGPNCAQTAMHYLTTGEVQK